MVKSITTPRKLPEIGCAYVSPAQMICPSKNQANMFHWRFDPRSEGHPELSDS